MHYQWIDYTSDYAPLVDSWLDEEAIKQTLCDNGWEDYYQYWKNESQTREGVEFWAKVICFNSLPIGIVAIGFQENTYTICEFIISPSYRRMGHGTQILKELLSHSKQIIGFPIQLALAVILADNHSSQKAFEKAGFRFDMVHPDGDVWYYIYEA